jgi:uncharacterized protein
MSNSLFDQLKKTGLVDEKKAKKAKHSQYKTQKKRTKKGAAAALDESAVLAQKAQSEKAERDRALNKQKKEEAECKAITAQIKQLIEMNRVDGGDGDVVYNFTDANVVKRLHVTATVYEHLVSGRLAIAKLAERYELVPMPVADKIKQRDEQCIICSEVSAQPSEEDDLYADYQIPDDLMW